MPLMNGFGHWVVMSQPGNRKSAYLLTSISALNLDLILLGTVRIIKIYKW